MQNLADVAISCRIPRGKTDAFRLTRNRRLFFFFCTVFVEKPLFRMKFKKIIRERDLPFEKSREELGINPHTMRR